MIVFGSELFTNDVVNLKHQGAGQKLMIGWHKHQGVSETPKNADVICEQPLSAFNNKISRNPVDSSNNDTAVLEVVAGQTGSLSK